VNLGSDPMTLFCTAVQCSHPGVQGLERVPRSCEFGFLADGASGVLSGAPQFMIRVVLQLLGTAQCTPLGATVRIISHHSLSVRASHNGTMS
jgi:hypothetical protein